jgi:putative DNA primase/helicase
MRAVGRTADRTDLRNAELLIEWFGEDLRYVGTWAKGLAWDGQRWVLDDEARWQRAAADTARLMFENASAELRAAGDDKDKAQRARVKIAWAAKSHGAARLAAMVNLAQTFESVIVRHDVLDADAWALNVSNGTIDLRTGKLRDHCRADLLTKIAPVTYDENAKAPTWDAFLNRAMGGDTELVAYLQRLIGYALSGNVSEHVLGFFFGPGANGKTTFLGTTHTLLGDYSSPAPRGLLFRARGERHPTELATLHGRRFVTCSEVEEGMAFDESLVKDLTGADPIECRRMREDFWTFAPTHKLFLAGNHKPSVRGDDEGIWRRIRLVPWLVTIPEAERDTELPEKLRAELPGILAWAVRGCLAWQKDGLATPQAVIDASAEYRKESDLLGQFFGASVVFEPEGRIGKKELRELYSTWCTEVGTEPLGAKRFAGRLREKGVREAAIRQGAKVVHGWRGVRLATDAERTAATAWAADCSYVATCSQENGYQHQTPPHEATNRESVATSSYVATDVDDDLDGFGDWLASKGVAE